MKPTNAYGVIKAQDVLMVSVWIHLFFNFTKNGKTRKYLRMPIQLEKGLQKCRQGIHVTSPVTDGLQGRSRGVPQGGPLSPLLSNIVLDELDKELERRGLRFVRYADDYF